MNSLIPSAKEAAANRLDVILGNELLRERKLVSQISIILSKTKDESGNIIPSSEILAMRSRFSGISSFISGLQLTINILQPGSY